ncbi:hypothetical protein Hanom_Chr01g00076461 [Helianthus anomalus]
MQATSANVCMRKRWIKCLRSVVKRVCDYLTSLPHICKLFFLFSPPKPLSLEHFRFDSFFNKLTTGGCIKLINETCI